MKKLFFSLYTLSLCFYIVADDHILNLTVQPYTELQFLVDGIETSGKLISTDKTLGTFEIHIPLNASTLVIKRKGYVNRIIYLHTVFSTFHFPYNKKRLYKQALSVEIGDREINHLLKRADIQQYLLETLTEQQPEVQSLFVALDKENSICSFVKAIDTSQQPKSLEFISENMLIVPLLDDKGFQVIDSRTGSVQLISPPEQYAKQKGFVESLYIPERNEIWVSQMSTACAHVFSADDFSYKATVTSTGQWSKVLAYNPTFDRVYLSNWISLNISVINPHTYTEERLISLANVPRGIAVSEDGKHLYFAEFESPSGASSGHIVKFSIENLTREKSFGAAGAKRHCVTDFKKGLLYVSDMSRNRIEVYSLKDESEVAIIPVYHNPNTIALADNGKFLIVSCRGPNNPDKGYLYKGYHFGQIHIIDTETFKTVDIIEGGNQPTGLAVSPDGKTFACSDFLDARIRIFRIKY
ncbi:MAG: YncE family protein [Spirochaetaceae bacterium]|nr:YncE family protein [Spirochaetaceae bacterium]